MKIGDSAQEELKLLKEQNQMLASINEVLSAQLEAQIEENQRFSLKIANLEHPEKLLVPEEAAKIIDKLH